MKEIQAVVSVKMKGKVLGFFIEDIDSTSKKINFEVDRNLYRKFQAVVGKGNVSEILRKFMKAVVRKFERTGIYFEGVKNERKKRKEKG